MTAFAKPDVIYVGYPKAASTFVHRFLDSHPEVTTDHNCLVHLLRPFRSPNSVTASPGKTHLSRDETVALSICMNNDINWRLYRWVPGAWDKVKNDLVLDPQESALRLKKVHMDAKVLMLIREQADWLHSAYKYSMAELPASQRAFADFCSTPMGIAYLQAGHFDQTIRAYIDVFGNQKVCVLRFEDIVSAPKRFAVELCAFIGISQRPIPPSRENETSAQLARIQKLFPIIERFPRKLKTALKPYATHLPGGRGMIISQREVRFVRSIYAASNQRTEKLLSQLPVWSR